MRIHRCTCTRRLKLTCTHESKICTPDTCCALSHVLFVMCSIVLYPVLHAMPYLVSYPCGTPCRTLPSIATLWSISYCGVGSFGSLDSLTAGGVCAQEPHVPTTNPPTCRGFVASFWLFGVACCLLLVACNTRKFTPGLSLGDVNQAAVR